VAKLASALAAACLLASACEANKSKLDEMPGRSGSSVGVATPAGTLADCPDADLKARLETALAGSKRYFVALQTHAATWSGDCEAVRMDLLTLESEAELFMQSVSAMRAWGKTVSAECRSRLEVLGEAHPISDELEAQSPTLEARVKPVLEKCNEHPGFKDAAKKGLRLLKKKKSP
jgi:hypothetical protein